MGKILFIGHDASRTGAPILLLNLLGYIKKNGKFSIHVLLKAPGPLKEEYLKIAPTDVFFLQQKKWKKIVDFFWINWLIKFFLINLLKRNYKKKKFDLIYSNTIANGFLLEKFSNIPCPVITHVHELNNIIDHYGEKNWELVKKNTNFFIAGSRAVFENLVKKRGIPADKIFVVHEFIQAFPDFDNQINRKKIRDKLNIPLNAFVVCGSGLCSKRKGTDLFLDLAEIIIKKCQDQMVFFLWVGGWNDKNQEKINKEKLARIPNNKRIIFTGEVEDPIKYYAASDIFSLVSREDPFPLVCLLAASVGKPILCFDGAGGIPEFVENDSGFVVSYLDIEQMSEKILCLMADPGKMERIGACAQKKVQKEYDIRVKGEKIIQIIERIIEDNDKKSIGSKNNIRFL